MRGESATKQYPFLRPLGNAITTLTQTTFEFVYTPPPPALQSNTKCSLSQARIAEYGALETSPTSDIR